MEKILEKYITTSHIYNGVLLGAKNISKYKEQLNLANRFPVPDNDTGDNLHYLMSKITRNLYLEDDINTMLSSIGDLAILNSRGNSGAIFSQFFVGLQKNSPKKNEIHISDFIKCFESGYESAYKSINNPILEGTILIAIKNWSDSLKKYINKASTVESLYEKCLKELKHTVENSKNVLNEQKSKKVNDAGAMAFLYFIEGFMSAIVHNKVHCKDSEDYTSDLILETLSEEHEQYNSSQYRFCTEVLLRKNGKEVNRKQLEKFGECLVISENKKYLKVHLHTGKPYKATEHISKYGAIMESKSDDMKLQSISTKIGEVALLIDSIADIPEHLHSEHTYMLPVNILIDNVCFKDKRTVFPELLNAHSVSSSQPTNKEMKTAIDKLLIGYDKVIILTVSSKMSGIYNQYKKIAENYDDSKVTLIDTKLNSVAEGLIVYKAIDLLQKNTDFETTIKEINKAISKSKIFVFVQNLNKMIASGRLNSRVGSFLKWINFLPLITIDEKGDGAINGFSFSQKRSETLLLKTVIKHADEICTYSVVHCNNLQKANEIATILTEKIGFPPAYISDISSVIQIFSGDGSIAVGFTLK